MGSLYIGLGGAGINAVAAIYKKKKEVDDNRDSDCYLLIDRDSMTSQQLPESLSGSFIDIGEQSPIKIKKYALNSPMKRWFVGWYDYYDIETPMHESFSCVRQHGRIALFGAYQSVYHRLLDNINQQEQSLILNEQLHIYVVTGSCGGTGSAILLDVLYMINTITRLNDIKNVTVCLLVVLPELWIGYEEPIARHNNIANAVAFFTELQFVLDNRHTTPSPFYPVIPPSKWMENEPFNPFDYGYAVDSSGKTKEQVSRTIADFVCSFGDVNLIIPSDVHNLTDGIMIRTLETYKKYSDGRYSFVDWKFERRVLELDKNSDVTIDEIWDRLYKQC